MQTAGKILGVDLGTVRTGIAISDPSGLLAAPVGTVTQRDLERLAEQVAQTAQEQAAVEIVVGHPRNMDGTRGESARRAEQFAEKLRDLTGLPVSLWDERMTTVSAIGILNQTNTRGQKRKAVVDTVAATIILQDYLDYKKLQR
ncbi:MAG TPA: Holliday junction resolvase RuvX [Firmicutes bacterium]|nr:Holliday junction resolvase RuvX [Bacillota bacterium]